MALVFCFGVPMQMITNLELFIELNSVENFNLLDFRHLKSNFFALIS